jgi:hypothetical protein
MAIQYDLIRTLEEAEACRKNFVPWCMNRINEVVNSYDITLDEKKQFLENIIFDVMITMTACGVTPDIDLVMQNPGAVEAFVVMGHAMEMAKQLGIEVKNPREVAYETAELLEVLSERENHLWN